MNRLPRPFSWIPRELVNILWNRILKIISLFFNNGKKGSFPINIIYALRKKAELRIHVGMGGKNYLVDILTESLPIHAGQTDKQLTCK